MCLYTCYKMLNNSILTYLIVYITADSVLLLFSHLSSYVVGVTVFFLYGDIIESLLFI